MASASGPVPTTMQRDEPSKGWSPFKSTVVALAGVLAAYYGQKLFIMVACIVRVTAEGGKCPRDCWVDPPPVPDYM